jgi:hypothetical protein
MGQLKFNEGLIDFSREYTPPPATPVGQCGVVLWEWSCLREWPFLWERL